MAKNMVVKNEYGAPQKQILLADELAFTIGAQIGNAGVTAVNGKKVVKAGTPLKGNLLDRDTAFVVDETEAANVILLHDVDVTDGDANGTIVVSGFVDLLKLDEDVQAKITGTVIGALKHIVFLKGSKV